ncbi:helix-turn-helix domain-containing protein [Bradyrhizobium sp. sGM-13]|uniref:helix-turn-helix domain-containing protein n=1 Tax=Bradyrhizobium sp. sGM-13 TaxID=2831781 RepID=UPI0035C7CF07
MGQSYEQLSLEDRCEIARLCANGSSIRQVAAAVDRSPSTVSRELKRNRGPRSDTNRAMPSNRRERGAGRALAWNGSPACAAR